MYMGLAVLVQTSVPKRLERGMYRHKQTPKREIYCGVGTLRSWPG